MDSLIRFYRKIINKNIKLAKEKVPNFPDKINPHKLRHSKATHLIDKGVSVLEFNANIYNNKFIEKERSS